jgi:menaquinone-dependent protoporphyrinogen oxidase
MRVVVAAASRHGATAEIAETIGGALSGHGTRADVVDIDDVHGLGDYDAVVLGSAVYMGHWLKPAAAFAATHSAELRARPTWLFSSVPVGDPPRPGESEAVDVTEIVVAAGAREHRLFAGKLDKSKLSFRDRAVMRAVGGQDGDYRDWDEIRAFAAAIRGEPGCGRMTLGGRARDLDTHATYCRCLSLADLAGQEPIQAARTLGLTSDHVPLDVLDRAQRQGAAACSGLPPT